MKHLLHLRTRIASLVLFVSLVLSFTTFATPASAHSLPTSKGPAIPPPCSVYLSSSPSSQNAHVGQEITVKVYWYCNQNQSIGIITDWRDGQSDSQGKPFGAYGNGSFLFYHTYVKTGHFITKSYVDYNSGINTYTNIYIS